MFLCKSMVISLSEVLNVLSQKKKKRIKWNKESYTQGEDGDHRYRTNSHKRN